MTTDHTLLASILKYGRESVFIFNRETDDVPAAAGHVARRLLRV